MNRAKAVRSVRMSFVMLAFEMVICGHEVSWFNRQREKGLMPEFQAILWKSAEEQDVSLVGLTVPERD